MAAYGWGTAVGVLFSWLSPKKRIERIKNEIDKLEKEKSSLLVQKCDVKKAARLHAIDNKLRDLSKRLQNSATGD